MNASSRNIAELEQNHRIDEVANKDVVDQFEQMHVLQSDSEINLPRVRGTQAAAVIGANRFITRCCYCHLEPDRDEQQYVAIIYLTGMRHCMQA